MHTALWIAQAFLAVVLLMAGLMKLRQLNHSRIGLPEVLGVIGLGAPMFLGVLPVLTAWIAWAVSQ